MMIYLKLFICITRDGVRFYIEYESSRPLVICPKKKYTIDNFIQIFHQDPYQKSNVITTDGATGNFNIHKDKRLTLH